MSEVYLKDGNWSKIFEFLYHCPGIYAKDQQKSKKFVKGVFWILRTGAQWSELPRWYGNYKSVHKRYNGWCAKGVWQTMLEHFSGDAYGEWVMLDSK